MTVIRTADENETAWLLEIPESGMPPLYFGPNRNGGWLTDVTRDHMRAVQFKRKEDAVATADWLDMTNVNRDPDPIRNFVPIEHMWMKP